MIRTAIALAAAAALALTGQPSAERPTHAEEPIPALRFYQDALICGSKESTELWVFYPEARAKYRAIDLRLRRVGTEAPVDEVRIRRGSYGILEDPLTIPRGDSFQYDVQWIRGGEVVAVPASLIWGNFC